VNGRLLVVVIETPDSTRASPLLKTLTERETFEIKKIPSIMLNSAHDVEVSGVEVQSELFSLLQGRNLSPQEIGCAASHNLARYFISKSRNGGVILEDDSRIVNPKALYNISNDFLNMKHGTASILSLCKFREDANYSFERQGYHKLSGQPYLALSYVLTPAAALRLWESNRIIRFVSDWPKSKVKYFVVLQPIVEHGDSETRSLIDVDGKLKRGNRNLFLKLQLTIGIRYIYRILKIIGPIEYLDYVYWRRITWKMDLILRRLIWFFKP